MEMKNRPPLIEDLLFVWNHIQERFHAIQTHNSKYSTKQAKTDDEREDAEKHFAHLRCILLLILDAVFYRTYPLLYHKFGNMVIFSVRKLIFTL